MDLGRMWRNLGASKAILIRLKLLVRTQNSRHNRSCDSPLFSERVRNGTQPPAFARSEAEKFRQTIGEVTAREGVHPRLIQAEREALQSQLEDLESELAEYEKLKVADKSVITVDSFEGFAEGLIKARIAAGLSQKALAERLHLKEQQIQRYESERYSSASYQRLKEVAVAIGVRIRNDILLPVAPTSFDGLEKKLRQVGINRDFLLSRLLSSSDAAQANGEVFIESDDALCAKAAVSLERVFGWTVNNLFDASALSAPRFAAAEARFKMPAARNQAVTSLYASYANYLSVVAIKSCRDLKKEVVPADPREVLSAIMKRYGSLNLTTALHYVWDLGIPVIPLRDRGTFHGACWRYDGRNAIVLKQRSPHESRWLFDLLHELFHAAQHPEASTLEVIEADETSAERRNSDEEIAASQFAGDVTLSGRAEDVAQDAVQAASGSVERLKSVLPNVAKKNSVDVGALANFLAFRLSWQNINWWGAAANLQMGGGDPWSIARNVFFERFPFRYESEIDSQLLERALQGDSHAIS